MREQVKALEHHANAFAHLVEVGSAVVSGKAVDHHLAFADRLQGIHAAQEGTFPRAGRADDAHHFLRFNIAADAAQHVAVAEALM